MTNSENRIEELEKQLRESKSNESGWRGLLLIDVGQEIFQNGGLERQVIGGAMCIFGAVQMIRAVDLYLGLGKRTAGLLHRVGIIKDHIDRRL